MAGGGPWARLAAALAPPAPPALRRPRPSARHQTELLLLLLDSPPLPERCPAGADPGAAAPGSDGSDPGAALLALLSEPAPGPPRCLLLVAALSVLAARGDRAGLAALAALLQRPGTAGTAPAAAAECERELRRIAAATGTPGTTGNTGTGTGTTGTPGRGCPAPQPLLLLRAEGAADPADPWGEAGLDPGSAFGLAPPARAQLLHLPRSGAGGGGPGRPPVLACADPAPVQAALLGGGSGRGGGRGDWRRWRCTPRCPPPCASSSSSASSRAGGVGGGTPKIRPAPRPSRSCPPIWRPRCSRGGAAAPGTPPSSSCPVSRRPRRFATPPKLPRGGLQRDPRPLPKLPRRGLRDPRPFPK
ncbi:uncharacterized protein LOC141726399 isoform X2 [Zonotrichia albicollis]|uniref:uncharacterized protein LOC141726399 isoform X2 n=1 Tax=Zonotrichia albicollis TaxID=44394 RepID=UPI003D80C7A8